VIARSETGTAPTLGEAAGNVAMGTAAGAILGGAFHAAHAGPKALYERWNRLPEAVRENAPLEVRDAMKVLEHDTIYGEANRLGLPWATHERYQNAANDPILRGRAVRLEDLQPADTPMTALGTILREEAAAGRVDPEALQRGAARVAALPDAELEPFVRQMKPGSFKALDEVNAKLDDIKQRHEAIQREADQIGVPDVVDIDTAAILNDIDRRLNSAPVTREQRRALRDKLAEFDRQATAAAVARNAPRIEALRRRLAEPDQRSLTDHEKLVSLSIREAVPTPKPPPDWTPAPEQLTIATRLAKGWTPEKAMEKPMSLVDFVRKSGGLRNDQPEAADLLSQDVGRQPGLLRSKQAGGVGFDDMARRAHEQGYEIRTDERGGADAQHFHEMLIDDASGNQKHYPADAHTEAWKIQQQYFDELKSYLADTLGIKTKGMNPRDVAWILQHDQASARLIALAHKADTLGNRSSAELIYLLDRERASLRREILDERALDAPALEGEHADVAPATLDELERYYGNLERTARESEAGGPSARAEPTGEGSAPRGKAADAGSNPTRAARKTRKQQQAIEREIARLEGGNPSDADLRAWRDAMPEEWRAEHLDTTAALDDADRYKPLTADERKELLHERAQWIESLDVHGALTEQLRLMRREFFPEHGQKLMDLAVERQTLQRELTLAQGEAQREIDFIRTKLDKIETGQPPRRWPSSAAWPAPRPTSSPPPRRPRPWSPRDRQARPGAADHPRDRPGMGGRRQEQQGHGVRPDRRVRRAAVRRGLGRLARPAAARQPRGRAEIMARP
jgi:hypothetical protein